MDTHKEIFDYLKPVIDYVVVPTVVLLGIRLQYQIRYIDAEAARARLTGYVNYCSGAILSVNLALAIYYYLSKYIGKPEWNSVLLIVCLLLTGCFASSLYRNSKDSAIYKPDSSEKVFYFVLGFVSIMIVSFKNPYFSLTPLDCISIILGKFIWADTAVLDETEWRTSIKAIFMNCATFFQGRVRILEMSILLLIGVSCSKVFAHRTDLPMVYASLGYFVFMIIYGFVLKKYFNWKRFRK